MRLRAFPAAGALLLAVVACDNTLATGTVVGPLVGPRVIESQLALDVVGGAPVGITDIFESGDFVNLWVHWAKLEPPHVVEVVWLDPSNGAFESSLNLTENVSEQVTVFTLELGVPAPSGRWEVEVLIDGEFMRSHLFFVLAP